MKALRHQAPAHRIAKAQTGWRCCKKEKGEAICRRAIRPLLQNHRLVRESEAKFVSVTFFVKRRAKN
jgi:hypothetical protein